jgi:hypothetical protein
MAGFGRVVIAIKALSQIGPARLAENGLYRVGLRLNWWKTPLPSLSGRELVLNLEALPPVTEEVQVEAPGLLEEAEEIVGGKVRLFNRISMEIFRHPAEKSPLKSYVDPWQAYESGRVRWPGEDIKFCWEPARFGWAVTLARAYRASGDERYAQAFWNYLDDFRLSNPAYNGPNWISGQEAALRIITWGFILRVMAGAQASSGEQLAGLERDIAVHAARIMPTLIYARSQDNNHLLSEAAGLYTAGLLLPQHAQAPRWRREGWKWFNRALQHQIDPDGGYTQQSVIYHRLMLQLCLWVDALARRGGDLWPEASRERLAAATRWMWARMDEKTGRAPNLGHNDGSYLFAFGEYSDQRPVVQATGRAFLGQKLFEPGPWDEFSRWLGLMVLPPANDFTIESDNKAGAHSRAPLRQSYLPNKQVEESLPIYQALYRDSGGLVLRAGKSWACLRAAQYHQRPGQADQLQVELWKDGTNLLLDPGTYRYNAAPPWDNGLASALVHNAVTVDGCEPMTRGGRFLWLDWDQARVLSAIPGCATAERDGYRRLGVHHKRTLECQRDGSWLVTDELFSKKPRSRAHEFSLNWLLPDGEWSLESSTLAVELPTLKFSLQVECQSNPTPQVDIGVVRAGKLVGGQAQDVEKLGWVSPTYAVLQPALSLCVRLQSSLPLKLRTLIQFSSP